MPRRLQRLQPCGRPLLGYRQCNSERGGRLGVLQPLPLRCGLLEGAVRGRSPSQLRAIYGIGSLLARLPKRKPILRLPPGHELLHTSKVADRLLPLAVSEVERSEIASRMAIRVGMVATRPAKSSHPSLIRHLAGPAAVTVALAALAACGGSSAGVNDGIPSAGAGGSASTAGTTAGQGGATSGSAGSANGGKQTVGGGATMGGNAGTGQQDGGRDAGGAPGEPRDPPGGMAGAGGTEADCPLQPPSNSGDCTDLLKCKYPGLECRCEGPEADRNWKCKEPPKPMSMCPLVAPAEDAPCKTKAEEPAPPPCHYEEPAVDCQCTADKWACVG
jgi:hypothetical protein